MIKWLNYHHLLYFRVIATEGSISKASDKLHIGQSALSAQLKQLEESLGQLLFERKNRSLVLTEAGRVALEYADEIFKKGEEFVQVFNHSSLAKKSLYRIGVMDSVPKKLACSILEVARQLRDDFMISLVEGEPEDLSEQLNQHKLDIVLTSALSATTSFDLIPKSIGSSKVSLYGSEKFLSLIQNFPKSLQNAPLVLPTKHNKLRYDIEHAYQEHHIQYDLVAEVQDSSVKKLLAEHGHALAFLPEFAVKEHLDEKKLHQIGHLTGINEEYWLLTKKRTIQNPITNHLLNEFKLEQSS